MDGHTVVGAVSAPSTSPTSPVSLHRHNSMKRKRSEGGLGIDSSPGSVIGDDDPSMAEPEKKRQPGVKRYVLTNQHSFDVSAYMSTYRHIPLPIYQSTSLPT